MEVDGKSALEESRSISSRIRKIKCDEGKPFCRKCVSTGRACDGYESPFRVVTSQPVARGHAGDKKSDTCLQLTRAPSTQITLQDIDLLNRYLSTKTIFDVRLPCDEEARQILQASLTEPPIRHAVLALRALRQDLETSPDGLTSLVQQTPGYNYGLQQYSMALRGLASQLSSPSSNELKSALLCCQVLISIEQVRSNFAAMALHIIRGLMIMHECRARPHFITADRLAPACHSQLPFLDVFIIKLFAAPCKFAELEASADTSETTSPHQLSLEPCGLPKLAPNMRTELVRIAEATLELLAKLSQVESLGNALQLLSEKEALLDSLETWLSTLERLQKDINPPSHEPLAVTFMRLFHRILKIVLLGVLETSSDLDSTLLTESDRLQSIAITVGERVKAYRMGSGPSKREDKMGDGSRPEAVSASPELTNQR